MVVVVVVVILGRWWLEVKGREGWGIGEEIVNKERG